MRILIKDPLAILADNAKGGVVVEDSKIVECLDAGEVPTQLCDEIFDASECVVLPGLINTHHHFYQTLSRAYGPALDKE
ncbi:MAG: 8-oxoguanine deaminase, partial [Pseudomonadota bacterium]|nr:8-oxoguanine deaminase [Pseudomonadota bacterium]